LASFGAISRCRSNLPHAYHYRLATLGSFREGVARPHIRYRLTLASFGAFPHRRRYLLTAYCDQLDSFGRSLAQQSGSHIPNEELSKLNPRGTCAQSEQSLSPDFCQSALMTGFLVAADGIFGITVRGGWDG
jgi:hypothetical protein